MTDKEFKRLSRAQLVDVIYQLQLQVDELTEEKQKLEHELADKRLRISKVGNLAEAALEMNDCFQNAQKAAEQYLSEIKIMREETKEECRRIVARTREEAAAILKKYKQEHLDNG